MYSRCARYPSATVFHYTDRGGLVGILDSGELRATDISYMNDARESVHGSDLIRQRFRAYADGHADDHAGRAMRTILEWLERIPIIPVFVVCFCEDGDALSQWRAYAPHGGYAIGVRPVGIMGIQNGIKFGATFGPVIYDLHEQETMVDELIAEVVEAIQLVPTIEWNDERAMWLAYRVSTGSTLLSAHLKHPRFVEEREWRFVLTPADDQIRYRAGRSLLTPYVPISIDPEGVVISDLELVAGPTPHRELALKSGTALIKSKQESSGKRADSERFRNSEIPYRDW